MKISEKNNAYNVNRREGEILHCFHSIDCSSVDQHSVPIVSIHVQNQQVCRRSNFNGKQMKV